jgi:Zn-dependent protease with chaperone function
MLAHLNKDNLVCNKESTYFAILAIFATIFWFFFAISIIGLFYALFFAIFIWFSNGLFVALIRSESVECSETQFPDLYRTFKEVCAKVGLDKMPRLYVLQSDGMLNAFATRHSGRDFVVIYSSLYEGLGRDSDEMRFLIGHELGHIHRKHVLKFIFLMPTTIIPLLWLAYRRSVESTCDRYGTFAAGNVTAAAKAMMVLTAGKEPSKDANSPLFAEQYTKERGFFVSWHELASTYPTLSQRTYQILSLANQPHPTKAPRSFLGYIFAFFFSRSTLFALIFLYIVLVVIVGVRHKEEKAKTQTQSIYQEFLQDEELAKEEF